ncbi:MAG: AraC family transcriptional regulator [Clostridiales bacterium]|nr:AraC family transcriptional regulator [Clostridiales bacterium]
MDYIAIRKQRVDLIGDSMNSYRPHSANERIVYSQDIPYSIVKQQNPMLIPLHFADTLEIMISYGAEGMISLGNQSVPLAKDGIIFILPHVIHGGRFSVPDNAFVYNLKFSMEQLNPVINVEKLLNINGHTLHDLAFSKPDYPRVLEALERLIDVDDLLYERNCQVLRLFDLFEQGIPSEDKKSGALDSSNANLHELLLWTEQHYREHITLEDAANHIHLSRCYFCRYFKEKTGTGYIQYLNQIRISHAVECLLAGKSVSECCYESGFQNVPYFIQIFKKITGYTTQAYLQLYK